MSRLSLEAIVVRHEGASREAVRGVSLEVGVGQTLSIVGESGSGKSSVLLAWLGLVPVRRGVVRWGDRALASLGAAELRRARRTVQAVFQDPSSALDPRFTVERTLREPWEVHHEAVPAGALEALLREVQLGPELLPRFPRELSSGQRQRVALARALALRPDVLLLDEPVSALDVTVQGQIIELLNRLQRERGLSMVLVSHDLDVVRLVGGRVAVMLEGLVVEEGPVATVLSAPRHPLTKALRGRLELAAPVRRAEPPGCPLRLRCPLVKAGCEQPQRLSGDEHRVACVEG